MIAFIDIETAGWSKEKNALCEVAVIITDGTNIVTEFSTCISTYIRESGEPVSYKDDAMAVNGITMQEIQEGTNIKTSFSRIITWIQEHNVHTVAGHGITSFDLPWLNYLMMRFNQFNFVDYNVIDTLIMCRNAYTGSHKLEDACIRYGIEQGNHRALNDARASFELWKILSNRL